MRKIASNYIITPAGELLEMAYFIVDMGEICGWAQLPNAGKEVHGVEFYSGMLIPGKFDLSGVEIGESIFAYINRTGYCLSKQRSMLSLVSCLDWSKMAITNKTTVSKIV